MSEQGMAMAPRRRRRLSDKILEAFHQACDQGDLEVARDLLDILEVMVRRSLAFPDRRKEAGQLVAAHERLWDLRQAARQAAAPPHLPPASVGTSEGAFL